MSLKQFSDQTLLELVDVEESDCVVSWEDEWKKMFKRFRDLENKFEELSAKQAGTSETPIDVFQVVRELTELTGESVNFEIWDHVLDSGGHTVDFKLYSVKGTQHFRGNTFAECEQAFRTAFAKPAVEEEL